MTFMILTNMIEYILIYFEFLLRQVHERDLLFISGDLTIFNENNLRVKSTHGYNFIKRLKGTNEFLLWQLNKIKLVMLKYDYSGYELMSHYVE